jgi:hypothetical protein
MRSWTPTADNDIAAGTPFLRVERLLETLIATVRSSRVSEPLLEYPPVPPQAYFSSALNP